MSPHSNPGKMQMKKLLLFSLTLLLTGILIVQQSQRRRMPRCKFNQHV